ncbi:MAG: 4Fe-4S ferredoxin, partial [Syntrophobacteraceae bacterium]|nr:4Fe-4S ferredoxin [Syntrophobacteraceae bacterium]
MHAYTDKIREIARRLLSENRVDVVIGYRRGTVPFMNEPYLAKTPEQADRLHWDGFCGVNLANYLPRRTDRVGIVAKGCDSRNMVVQILENQIPRDHLYIIGAPCKGMLDRKKIAAELQGKEALTAEDNDDKLQIQGR